MDGELNYPPLRTLGTYNIGFPHGWFHYMIPVLSTIIFLSIMKGIILMNKAPSFLLGDKKLYNGFIISVGMAIIFLNILSLPDIPYLGCDFAANVILNIAILIIGFIGYITLYFYLNNVPPKFALELFKIILGTLLIGILVIFFNLTSTLNAYFGSENYKSFLHIALTIFWIMLFVIFSIFVLLRVLYRIIIDGLKEGDDL